MAISGSGKFARGKNKNIKTFGDFADNCASMWGGDIGSNAVDRTADDKYLAQIRKNRGAVKSLAIDDPMAKAAIDYRVQLAVGTKVRIKPNVLWQRLGWTQKQNREFRQQAKELWKMHMESDNRWIDASGLHTISELAAQHTRIFEAEGEAMAVIYELGVNRRSPLSFAIGNVDPDRVRTPVSLGAAQQFNIHDGILKSRRNYHSAYYVHDFHRRDSRARTTDTDKYRLIPTRNAETGREQFIHSFVQQTSDLSRGISQLASCLTLNCQKSEYVNAALEDAISKAGLTFIVKSNAQNLQDLMGVLSNYDGDPLSDYMEASREWHEGLDLKHKGNKIARLLHGESIEGFSADQAGGATFEAFNDTMDLIAASCHGLSMEEYRQEWSKTNFSGARSGKLYVWNMIKALRAQAPWRLVRKAYCLFIEDMILQGHLLLPGLEDDSLQAWFYFLDNRDALCCVEFFGSPKDEIDLAKTAEYYLSLKELGIFTQESICNELLNEDWEDRLDQIIEEVTTLYERLDSHGEKPSWTVAEKVSERVCGTSESGAPAARSSSQ